MKGENEKLSGQNDEGENQFTKTILQPLDIETQKKN